MKHNNFKFPFNHKKPWVFAWLFVCFLSASAGNVFAAVGDLDADFGTGGVVLSDYNNVNNTALAVFPEANGSYIAVGRSANGLTSPWLGKSYDFAMAKYANNGVPDSSFGTAGWVTADFHGLDGMPYSAIRTKDGKIVVGGSSRVNSGTDRFAIARYLDTGVLDNSFGTGGFASVKIGPGSDRAYSVFEDSQGRYLLTGNTAGKSFTIARFHNNGTLDYSFGSWGVVKTSFKDWDETSYDIIEDSSGNYLVAGYVNPLSYSPSYSRRDFALARYTNKGVLDTSFGSGGVVYTDFAFGYDVALSVIEVTSGGYLAVGSAVNSLGDKDLVLVRYTNTGSLDTSFGTSGKVVTDLMGVDNSGSQVVETTNGNFLVVGSVSSATVYDSVLVRYTSDGLLDDSFGASGVVISDLSGASDGGTHVFETANGNYLTLGTSYINGNSDFSLARYVGDGFPNSPATISGMVAGQAANDNGVLLPFSTIIIDDADGDNVVVSVNQDNTTKGLFTPTSITASGFSDYGNGNYRLLATDVALAQAAIQQLVFAPTSNRAAVGLTETTAFTVTVNDGYIGTSDSTTTVVTTSVNDDPVFTGTPSISGDSAVGQTLTVIDTATTDYDVDDVVTLSYQWKADGGAVGTDSSSYMVTTAEAHKTITVDVTATDNNGGWITVSTSGVLVVNTPPSITSTPVTAVGEDVLYSYTMTATDVDNDTLTLSAPQKPSWLSFNPSTGLLSGSPANNHVGNHSVILRVNDGAVSVDQAFTITVNNANDNPIISSTPVTTAKEGVFYNSYISAYDQDQGDTLTYSAPSIPSWLNFNPDTQKLTGIPNHDDVGEHNVILRVSDGTVDVDVPFVITVNKITIAPTTNVDGNEYISTIMSSANTLIEPHGVFAADNGDIYVADYSGHKVLKLAVNGVVTTMAGTGTQGSAGNDGDPATSVQLNNPKSVVLDSNGNLYISDSGNHRVCKVSPDGTMTTYAGTGVAGSYGNDGDPAVLTQLWAPAGLALDSDENLYIADSMNYRIRKVSVADGTIITVAGSGSSGFGGDGGIATSALLSVPLDVAFDSQYNLYIADYGNNRVRKVTGGIIDTIAGNGTPGFSGDGGNAKYATLFGPRGILLDDSDNLYIADSNNHVIRKVADIGNIITTIAGTGGLPGYDGDGGAAKLALLSSPYDLAFDVRGNLLVAEWSNNIVRNIYDNGAPKLRKGVSYDGVGDHILLSSSAYPELITGSVEAWVRLDSLSGNVIIARQQDSVDTTGLFGVGNTNTDLITGVSPGHLYFHAYNGNPAGIAQSANALPLDEWTFVAVTFSSSGASFYINGVLDTTHSGDFSTPALSPTAVRIGDLWDASSSTHHGVLTGDLDGVAVWKRVLAETEIADHYLNGIATDSTYNLFRYNLDDASATDSSGGSSHFNGLVVGPVSTLEVTVNEGQTAATTMQSSDPDRGDSASYSLSGGLDVSLFSIDSVTGELSFISAPDFESPQDSGGDGIYNVQVSVTDAADSVDTADLVLSINDINDAPVNDVIPVVTGTALVGGILTATTGDWTDDDGDPLSYSYQWQADGVNIGADTNQYTITSNEAHKDITVIVTAKDSHTQTEATSLPTTVANTTPINTKLPEITGTAAVGSNLVANTGTWTDADGDSLTYNYQWQADGANIGTDASQYLVTSNEAHKNITVTVTAKDGYGQVDATSLASSVNNTAPGIESIALIAVSEDNPYSYIINAVDADNDNLTYSAPLLPSWMSFNAMTAELSGIPTNTEVGNHNVTLRVSDGTVNVDQSFVVTVNNVNDAPTVTSSAVTSVNEDKLYSYTFSASDVDAGDTLTLSAPVKPAWLSFTPATGVLSGTPGNAEVGDHNVTLRVNDGTVNVDQSFIVTVSNTNDAPTVTSSAVTSANEDKLYSYTFAASDVDAGDSLTLSAPVKPAWLSFTPATGVLSGTPTNAEVGDHNVTLRVNDGTVNVDQSFVVTVNNVNDAPTITSSAVTSANEDKLYSYTFAASDVDAGDSLTLSAPVKPAWLSFTPATGVLSGTPTNAEVGDHNVTLRVNDGTLDVEQSFIVTVSNTNDAPIISGSPTTSVNEDSPYSFTPSVEDVDAGDSHQFDIVNKPAWAGFDIATGTLSGTPTNTDVGITEGIEIRVSDSAGGRAQLPVFSLTVVNTNDVPVITGTPLTRVVEGQPYRFSVTATDEDGDSLSYSLSNAPSFISVDAGGVVSGIPERADVGSHSSIVVSVSDGHGGQASLAPFTLEVIGDLDRDGNTDGVDDDIDGDGMLNTFEDENGLDSYDAADAALDSDGDGLSNLEEFNAGLNPQEDDVAPVVTAPVDITIGATGIETPVELGEATAIDALDGVLTPTSDAPSLFTPGAHTVTWSATDAAGNTGEATQQVNVLPRVNFGPDQKSVEGAEVTVPVYLNGTAPSYPVRIGYTVSGSATSGEDHTLQSGEVELLSGLEGAINFSILEDSLKDHNETITLSLATLDGVVAGSKSEHTVRIVQGNLPPRVQLKAYQNGLPVTTVLVQNGALHIEVEASDANGDTLSYRWKETAGLVDQDNEDDTLFVFDPAGLEEGLYLFRVEVRDGKSKTTAALVLLLSDNPASLAADRDRDGDGLNDAREGAIDSDLDGLPDYLDDNGQGNLMVLNVGEEGVLQTEAGIQLQLGVHAREQGTGAALSAEVLRLQGVEDDDLNAPDGYIDIELAGLPDSGQSAAIVIPLDTVLTADSQLRRYNGKTWVAFKEDADNSLYSSNSVGGVCPEAGDSAYQQGLQEGADCVMALIRDGGANDADNSENQHITLLVGVSPQTQANNKGGNSGGSLLWLLGMLTLMGLWSRALRR